MAARSLLFAALIAGFAPAPAASTAPRSAAASIDLRIHVPRVLQARLVDASPYVEPQPGTGEAAGALSYEVVSNLAAYEIRVAVHDAQVEEVWLEGLGAPLHFGREGTVVAVAVRGAAERRQLRRLSYRVRFAAGTRPVRRAAPLSLLFSGA